MEKINYDDCPFYVSESKQEKEKIGEYTTYTVKGKKISEPTSRRYREFDALRKKLVERWPGIFIPQLPHKTKVGKNNKEVVELREEQINRFCLKLGKIPYLINSHEIEMFLFHSNDVVKTLNNIPSENYSSLLSKYTSSFPNFDENFRIDDVRKDHENFFALVKQILPKLVDFKNEVKDMRYKFTQYQENYYRVLLSFSNYEKEAIKEFANNNRGKYVFSSFTNKDLTVRKEKYKEAIVNPYDKLYDKLVEDVLDYEAILEAYNSFLELQMTLAKINKKGNDPEGASNLEKIIKIVVFELNEKMEAFKTKALSSYYEELWKIKQASDNNNVFLDDLYDSVLNDVNLKEIEIEN